MKTIKQIIYNFLSKLTPINIAVIALSYIIFSLTIQYSVTGELLKIDINIDTKKAISTFTSIGNLMVILIYFSVPLGLTIFTNKTNNKCFYFFNLLNKKIISVTETITGTLFTTMLLYLLSKLYFNQNINNDSVHFTAIVFVYFILTKYIFAIAILSEKKTQLKDIQDFSIILGILSTMFSLYFSIYMFLYIEKIL